MKTPEQVKRHEQYERYKDYHYQKYLEWCRDNPEGWAKIQKRWRDANPHYYRDYMRKRKAVTEPLIFEFMDNGFDNDIDSYVTYLRNNGVPEKHINWLKVDIKKHLGERKK